MGFVEITDTPVPVSVTSINSPAGAAAQATSTVTVEVGVFPSKAQAAAASLLSVMVWAERTVPESRKTPSKRVRNLAANKFFIRYDLLLIYFYSESISSLSFRLR